MNNTDRKDAGTIEGDLMADCSVREWVPGTWSDWYTHTAHTLALMYSYRGKGRPVGEFLQAVMDKGMVPRVEHIVAEYERPEAERAGQLRRVRG